MDVFRVFVDFVPGEGCFDQAPATTLVTVMAFRTNDATLAALEMVAATGRCPVGHRVDWANF